MWIPERKALEWRTFPAHVTVGVCAAPRNDSGTQE